MGVAFLDLAEHNPIMGRVIMFFVIPVLIGGAIDKYKKRSGPGWFNGFLVGIALYVIFLTASGQWPEHD